MSQLHVYSVYTLIRYLRVDNKNNTLASRSFSPLSLYFIFYKFWTTKMSLLWNASGSCWISWSSCWWQRKTFRQVPTIGFQNAVQFVFIRSQMPSIGFQNALQQSIPRAGNSIKIISKSFCSNYVLNFVAKNILP